MVKPELLDNVHTMVCGAAPVGPVLINEFRKKFTDRIQFQEGMSFCIFRYKVLYIERRKVSLSKEKNGIKIPVLMIMIYSSFPR